eukprot:SAG22_NODE_395_length_11139_cov_14.562500_6_plen_504_part_00
MHRYTHTSQLQLRMHAGCMLQLHAREGCPPAGRGDCSPRRAPPWGLAGPGPMMAPLSLALVGACLTPAVPAPPAAAVTVLAWDGSGDFGPHITAGTTTSGWQEALDHCAKTGRDLYVQGGSDLATSGKDGWGAKAVYFVGETVRVPPSQDFRIDGGVFVVAARGMNRSADVIDVDSCMNCYLELGTVVTQPGQTGAGVALRPRNPVPMDGFPTIVESRISMVNAPASSTPFKAEANTGVGLLFDSRFAGISSNDIHFGSILNFETNILANTTAHPISSNTLRVDHLHTNAFNSTLAVLGTAFTQNWVTIGGLSVDQGATGVTGIVVGGSLNKLELSAGAITGFRPGRLLDLQPTADSNSIEMLAPPALTSQKWLTDRSTLASNRLVSPGPPPPSFVEQLHAAPGPGALQTFLYTQRLYAATIFVESWSGVVVGNVQKPVPATVSRGHLPGGGDNESSVLFQTRVGPGASGGGHVDLSVGDTLTLVTLVTADAPAVMSVRVVPR